MPTRTRARTKRRVVAALAAVASVSALSPPSQLVARGVDSQTHRYSKREFTLINQDEVLKSYDYVIVGGGLAGLVLASRLSEDKDTSVIVLEAGLSGDEVKEDIDAPAGAYYNSIVGTDYDWKYDIVNQQYLNNRGGQWPRGKILGGSTAMNAMYLVRPAQVELDAWSNMLSSESDTEDGASNWNWANMFEAMKKAETFHAPETEAWEIGGQFPFSAENHGTDGPMHLGYPGVMFSAVGNWTAALDAAGIPPLEEPNGGVTMGGFISPSSINPTNWTRSYSRSAYIDSLPPRPNLHILPQATVTKIGFSDKHRANTQGERDQLIANTVEFGDEREEGAMEGGGTRYVIGVNREVVLAGGPLGSPKVLMHSGVGPSDVLSQVGMDVVLELPGVGQHLQDHMTAGVVWESRVETAGDVRNTGSEFSRSREFLSFINDAVAFAGITRLFGENSDQFQGEILNILEAISDGNSTTVDDREISLATLVPDGSPEVFEGYKATYNITARELWETGQIEMLMSLISEGVISIQSALQHPYSRGRVYINSTNPFHPIQIDPNYFSHPMDRVIMRQGVKMVRDVGNVLREMGVVGEEVVPGPGVQTDEDIDGWLRDGGANTQYHPMGSCAMLPRKWGGCVNSKLRVYGIANVRIADSSVFPFEFAAHLASATFGLAETASELIKDESYDVPKNAKVNERELGRQGGDGESGAAVALTGRGAGLGVERFGVLGVWVGVLSVLVMVL
ncbi:aryl-alcohol oxidase [Coprinopsis cinerea AmutBmut pab1-1]|nr:aryl-alcohol oxidase [Coprinopsis cinerea AmutBmut pab1-1]